MLPITSHHPTRLATHVRVVGSGVRNGSKSVTSKVCCLREKPFKKYPWDRLIMHANKKLIIQGPENKTEMKGDESAQQIETLLALARARVHVDKSKVGHR